MPNAQPPEPATAGIGDGTSPITPWGVPSLDRDGQGVPYSPVRALGIGMPQSKERPPQALEVASFLEEKWEEALQHMICLWMRKDVLDMVG